MPWSLHPSRPSTGTVWGFLLHVYLYSVDLLFEAPAVGWQISQMRSFPPDFSSCAGKNLPLVLRGERQWAEGCRGSWLCLWGAGGGRRSIRSRVGACLVPQPFAVSEGFCCSPSSALPAVGIIAPFCIRKHKPLTTSSLPWCSRGRDPTCSHSVTPYGQFVFQESRFFLTFGETVVRLGAILQLNNPLFLVSPSILS